MPVPSVEVAAVAAERYVMLGSRKGSESSENEGTIHRRHLGITLVDVGGKLIMAEQTIARNFDALGEDSRAPVPTVIEGGAVRDQGAQNHSC